MAKLVVQKSFFWRMTSAMLLFVHLFVGLSRASVASAAAPSNIISYQGRLLNSNRVPVSDASASILFELYTAASGGSCVWSNSSATCATAIARTVTLTDGLFSEHLGDTAAPTPYAAIGDSVFGDNSALYLQVTINGETLTPRKRIVSAPYAINSQLLDGLNSDSDGSTSAAIVALNSSGNMVIAGNPGSTISSASLYINPASGDVAANDFLFAVASGDTLAFGVDAEGDVTMGNLQIGSVITAAGGEADLFDSSVTTNIDIGGVSADAANVITIAANALSADTITIGNSHASTTLALEAGNWSISSGGVGAFNNVNCTDCIDWNDFADTATLDASTTITLGNVANPNFIILNQGSGGIITNLAGTGDVSFQDNGVDFLTLSDSGGFSFVSDDVDSPPFQVISQGTGNIAFDLAGSGGSFRVIDNGVAAMVVDNNGSYSFNLDNVDNPTYTITNAGSSNIITNLSGTGDFVIQDEGTTFASFSDSKVITFTDAYTLGGSSRLGQTVFNSSVTGTWSGGLSTQDVTVFQMYADYQGHEAIGTDGLYSGLSINAQVSGTGDLNSLYGIFGGTTNTSTDPSAIESSMYGVYGRSLNIQAVTVPNAYGLYGHVEASAGTITNAYGVRGHIASGAGALTNAYGGYFENLNDGTTRFGVYGGASGGTNNFAGYFSTSGASGSYGLYVLQNEVADATTAPTGQALVIDVNEAANTDDVILIRSDADNSSGVRDTEFRFENNGDAFADGAWTGGGADYAEFFPTTDRTLGDYEIVCWNPLQERGVKRCETGETRVVGVISTDPGFIGNAYAGAESNLENDPNYALVGLVGQIETFVTAESGAIRVGDALTTSISRAGYAAKASGGTYIIGRALEALSSGTGTIRVLVQPMWYGGEMLTMDGEAAMLSGDLALVGNRATSSRQAVDSAGLSFVGSQWNGSSAEEVSLSLRHALSMDGASRLALQNDGGMDVITFGSTGDLAIAGNFYPSDRGTLQYGAYVYYDSTGTGYMRTNASGWMSNGGGYAESFSSLDTLMGGEVVEFSSASRVVRSSGEAYSDRVVGVVSSGAGFVAGEHSSAYSVIVSGRASVRVSDENGAIVAGDALAASGTPGYVMKATDSGYVVGYALESWSSGQGALSMFVRPQYLQGTSVHADSSSLALGSQDVETLNVLGALSMNGGNIISVGTLSGLGTWEIRENGDIVTQGQLTQVVQSLQNTRVSTFATTSTETIVQLSGTSVLRGGMSRISFEEISPEFNDIISPESPYRVLVTPNDITGQLYVTDRTNDGFVIRDAQSSEGVSVDWLVLAYRHDFVPEAGIDLASPDFSEDIGSLLPAEEDVHEEVGGEEQGVVSEDASLSDEGAMPEEGRLEINEANVDADLEGVSGEEEMVSGEGEAVLQEVSP